MTQQHAQTPTHAEPTSFGLTRTLPIPTARHWTGTVIKNADQASEDDLKLVTLSYANGERAQVWCAAPYQLAGENEGDLYPDELHAAFPNEQFGDLFQVRDLILLITPAGLRQVQHLFFPDSA